MMSIPAITATGYDGGQYQKLANRNGDDEPRPLHKLSKVVRRQLRPDDGHDEEHRDRHHDLQKKFHGWKAPLNPVPRGGSKQQAARRQRTETWLASVRGVNF
jgi:hypothetical protein